MNESDKNKMLIDAVEALCKICDYLENNYETAKKNEVLRTIRMLNGWRTDF